MQARRAQTGIVSRARQSPWSLPWPEAQPFDPRRHTTPTWLSSLRHGSTMQAFGCHLVTLTQMLALIYQWGVTTCGSIAVLWTPSCS
jgi:hypothetical protein